MKEIGTCKECRFWAKGEFSNVAAINDALRFKDFPDLKTKVGSCRRQPDLHQDMWDVSGLPYEKTYQCSAWVDYDTIDNHFIEMTGPDFGCIHWEAKNELDKNN